MALAAIVAIATTVMAATQAAASTVILVPSQQPTIQTAIDAASAGDVVRVAAGVYFENLNFAGKDTTVESLAGPAQTLIDGRGSGPVVVFEHGESRAAAMRGFTIRHGTTSATHGYQGGGVSIKDASPSIVGNWIVDNHGLNGLGIGSTGGAPRIEENYIADNTGEINSNGYGGGIFVGFNFSDTPTVIRRNIIARNSNDNGGAIGSWTGQHLDISENYIAANRAIYRGGAFSELGITWPVFERNWILANTAGEGSAMDLEPVYGQPAVLRGNAFIGNYSSSIVGGNGQGAGFYVGGPALTLTANYVIGQPQRALFRCAPFPPSGSITLSTNLLLAPGGPLFDGCTDVTGDVTP